MSSAFEKEGVLFPKGGERKTLLHGYFAVLVLLAARLSLIVFKNFGSLMTPVEVSVLSTATVTRDVTIMGIPFG
jgi:hypothetical protein